MENENKHIKNDHCQTKPREGSIVPYVETKFGKNGTLKKHMKNDYNVTMPQEESNV